MNPDQSQIPGLPVPQSSTPAGGYKFAAPVEPASHDSEPPAPDPHERRQHPANAPPPVPPIVATTTANIADSDDTDEVEEVWVEKAREIVSQTTEDPYAQTVAIARLKTDFLKSRYGKDIKLSEDVAK